MNDTSIEKPDLPAWTDLRTDLIGDFGNTEVWRCVATGQEIGMVAMKVGGDESGNYTLPRFDVYLFGKKINHEFGRDGGNRGPGHTKTPDPAGYEPFDPIFLALDKPDEPPARPPAVELPLAVQLGLTMATLAFKMLECGISGIVKRLQAR